MSLSRIYINADLSINSSLQLPDTTSHYVKNVLRLKTDQSIILFNGKDSAEYTARLEIQGKQTLAFPVSQSSTQLESPLQTTLLQAIGKSEHIDLVVQKSTELVVSQIILFNSQRTQIHLKASRLEKKLAHWHKIMISACEQCGRNTLPGLGFKSNLHSCLESLTPSNKILLNFDGESIRTLTNEFNQGLPFSMLVGPEGGLTVEEIQQATKADFKSCSLGPRILRMETAAMSILNLVQHHFGDMP